MWQITTKVIEETERERKGAHLGVFIPIVCSLLL